MNRQTKKLLVLSLTLIALVVVQFLVWRFVQAAAVDYQDIRTKEQQLKQLQDRLQDINEQFTEQKPLQEQLPVIFPGPDNTPRIIERLEQLADSQGVRLRINAIKEEAPRGPKGKEHMLVPLNISLAAFGAPDQLFGYIEALEYAPEIVAITNWRIRPNSQVEAEGGRYELLMNIEFYLYTPPVPDA